MKPIEAPPHLWLQIFSKGPPPLGITLRQPFLPNQTQNFLKAQKYIILRGERASKTRICLIRIFQKYIKRFFGLFYQRRRKFPLEKFMRTPLR